MRETFIIAEAGVNHNGCLDRARELVDVAKNAGADAVKFQTFRSSQEIAIQTEKAEYQKKTTGTEESFLDMVKKLELSDDAHYELYEYCNTKKIEFLSTPFEAESIDFLFQMDLRVLKISSGQVTNLPFLRKIGGLGKDLILSTGMSTLEEVGDALEILYSVGAKRKSITLMHCTTAYPTKPLDVNLAAMMTMKKEFGVDVGYSDHTLGIEVAVAAVALGATMIEKHITLSRKLEGPDHQASLEPDELKNMITAIRNTERAIGDGQKIPARGELENINVARRSIVALRAIRKGELFSERNITVKSPANGISPMKWDTVIGQIAKQDFNPDDFIEI